MTHPVQEFTFHIDATLAEWAPNGVFFTAVSRETPADDYLRLRTETLLLPIPSRADLINVKISGLELERTRVRAEAEKRATEIEKEIQTLLAISYDTSKKA